MWTSETIRLYRVTFEVPHPEIPLVLFHPVSYVEAKNELEAGYRASLVFDSNEGNKLLRREIAEVAEVTVEESESLKEDTYIFLYGLDIEKEREKTND